MAALLPRSHRWQRRAPWTVNGMVLNVLEHVPFDGGDVKALAWSPPCCPVPGLGCVKLEIYSIVEKGDS